MNYMKQLVIVPVLWWSVLGILMGTMVWVLGLGRGVDDGFAKGMQALETGQAQFKATESGFDQYFTVKALLEGMTGVTATSARIEFPATVSNAEGQTRQILIRGVSFVQENKVTDFQSRIKNGVSGPISGLIVPSSWGKSQFLSPSAHAKISLDNGLGTKVVVTGTIQNPRTPDGQEYAVLDLETALAIAAGKYRVSCFAIRLASGKTPEKWVEENRSSVKGLPAELVSWTSLSAPLRTQLVASATPLWIFRDFIVLMNLLLSVGLGWLQTKKRFETKPTLLVGTALVTATATLLALQVCLPLWESGLIKGLIPRYPFLEAVPVTWSWGIGESYAGPHRQDHFCLILS